jgi:hypothetical protein
MVKIKVTNTCFGLISIEGGENNMRKNSVEKKGMAALEDDALENVAGGVDGVTLTGSGSFMSNTGTSLNIIVNWYAGIDIYGNRGLMIVVSATSGNLTAGSLLNCVEVSVNGMSYAASNNPINYYGGGVATNTLATFTIPNVYGNVSITAVWHFNGTYGGVPVGSIYANGMATV